MATRGTKTDAATAPITDQMMSDTDMIDEPAPVEAPMANPEISVDIEAMVGAQFSDLLADVRRDQITWLPKGAGATIAGLVKDIHTITTRFGPRSVTVLDLNPSDPTLPLFRFAWLGSVLETAFDRENVQVGDRVAVRHLGEVETENGTYANWRVIVRKAPGNMTAAQMTDILNRPPAPGFRSGETDDF